MNTEELRIDTPVPQGVTVTVDKYSVTVKGEKGELSRRFPSKKIVMTLADGALTFTAKNATLREKKLIYTFVAHAKNMFRGVQKGHSYKLKICSGHFPMNVSIKDNKLEVKNFIGEAVSRVMPIAPGVDVKVEGDQIMVSGVDKERVSQLAGRIENLTKRPGFDTRIFQDGIYLVEKDGKIIG